MILLREGLEAILVLAAIFALLIKGQRRDALPYVHAGWIAALALGGITWLVASSVVAVSGPTREIDRGCDGPGGGGNSAQRRFPDAREGAMPLAGAPFSTLNCRRPYPFARCGHWHWYRFWPSIVRPLKPCSSIKPYGCKWRQHMSLCLED